MRMKGARLMIARHALADLFRKRRTIGGNGLFEPRRPALSRAEHTAAELRILARIVDLTKKIIDERTNSD